MTAFAQALSQGWGVDIVRAVLDARTDTFIFLADPAPTADMASSSSAMASTALLQTYTSGTGDFGFVSDFNVEIVFEGTWTAELQQSFIIAAEYLSYVITGDERDHQGVDDIRITASLEDIDGPGGILGQAGPTATRFFGGIPSQGIMEFDVADATEYDALGLFDDIVLHEMLHCLGIGTIWNGLELTTGTVRGDDMRFIGTNAILAYNFGLREIARSDPDRWTGVPVETDGGPGTAGGHWDDRLFDNELMTGFVDDFNFVSGMTIASLEDLGYDTIFVARQPGADVIQPDAFVDQFGFV